MGSIMSVVSAWAHTLQQASGSSIAAGHSRPESGTVVQLVPARSRWLEPEGGLWQALETILLLCRQPALKALLESLPLLVDTLVHAASHRQAAQFTTGGI